MILHLLLTFSKKELTFTKEGLADGITSEFISLLLCSGKCPIKSLKFDFQIGDAEVKCLALMLKTNSKLEKIDLSSNKFTDCGVEYLAEMFMTNTTLTDINLSKNKFTDIGAKFLADMLKTNSSLTKINLSYNAIKENGVKYLSEALFTNSTLQCINLDICEMTDELAKSIARMLTNNYSLQHSSLSNMSRHTVSDSFGISERGVDCLAKALRNNSTLQSISIQGDEDGIIVKPVSFFEEEDNSDSRLIEITLTNCQIETNDLKKALESKYNIININLGKNDMEGQAARWISEMLI